MAGILTGMLVGFTSRMAGLYGISSSILAGISTKIPAGILAGIFTAKLTSICTGIPTACTIYSIRLEYWLEISAEVLAAH